MDTNELYSGLKRIEASIESRGLRANVRAHFNWCGDPISIGVEAKESADANGAWSSERRFRGTTNEVHRLLDDASSWVSKLPGAEDRALELMIRKLNELAGQLPKGSGELAQAAWREIHNMLTAKAEQLAKNGLPSPDRISKLSA